MRTISGPGWSAAVFVSLCLLVAPAALAPGVADDERVEDPLVDLNLPEDLEVTVLADLVSDRLNVNIVYDEKARGKRVTIKTPAKVPRSSLLDLLRSTLRMKGLALVEAEQAGWLRIVEAQNLVSVAGRAVRFPDGVEPDGPIADPHAVVTQVFVLEHAPPRQVEELIKPFLTQPGASSFSVEQQGLVVVTDYASNLPRVAELIDLADRPGLPVATRFVMVRHLEAGQLARQVDQILQTRQRLSGAAGAGQGQLRQIEIVPEERTNQLVLLGPPGRVDEAMELIASLDVPLELETVVYQFEAAPPERIDQLARNLLDPVDAKRLYRSAIDRESGVLVATTTSAMHESIEALKQTLDVPLAQDQSPVRIYKLANAKAADVLETIRAIEEAGALGGVRVDDQGGNVDGGGPGVGAGSAPEGPPVDSPVGSNQAGPAAAAGPTSPYGLERLEPGAFRAVRQAVQTERVTVTADVNTNSLIVVAEPSIQRIFEHLIEVLDRRRPQVLVEVTLVTLDTSGGYSFGVEISRSTETDEGEVLTFSSFGLSEVDADTGSLSLSPGLGFNGALISADIADVVIRALKTTGRSKVVAAPRILVNDNATGTLSSVNQAPFTSVNASDTVATTSFAGFEDAGTTISITPHISEGDHLVLEYELTLSSFTGEAGEGIPPPRQSNTVQSEVTIPDGHAIIVGGLSRTDTSDSKQSVPILGDIPLLEYAFSSRNANESVSTLFAFIRPVILRDDRFEDLKYLSQRDLKAAGLPGEYPDSEPLLVR